MASAGECQFRGSVSRGVQAYLRHRVARDMCCGLAGTCAMDSVGYYAGSLPVLQTLNMGTSKSLPPTSPRLVVGSHNNLPWIIVEPGKLARSPPAT